MDTNCPFSCAGGDDRRPHTGGGPSDGAAADPHERRAPAAAHRARAAFADGDRRDTSEDAQNPPLPTDGRTEVSDDALPGSGRVLDAVATGVWRWERATETVVVDAETAHLLGLPPRPVRLSTGAMRSRFHPEDWNEADSITSLAYAEGTLAEFPLRVVDEQGREIRTVRVRCRPVVRPPGGDGTVLGTMQEIAGMPGGASVPSPARVTGEWRRSREAFLLDAGRALAEARSTDEVLRLTAGLAMPGFSPDGLAIFRAVNDEIRLVGHFGHDESDLEPFVAMPLDSDHPAAEVLRTGRPIYLTSPEEYRARHPRAWPVAERFGRHSWSVLPLTVGGRMVGAWLAAFAYPVRFTADERAVLTTVARMLAQTLYRAEEEESERRLAAGIQRAMMPSLGPPIPGLSLTGRYVPTGGGLQVGGDWYDVISLPSGSVALVIGDVQGHDVRAAGVMGQLRLAVRAYAVEGHRPEGVLSRACRFLSGLVMGSDRQMAPRTGAAGAPSEGGAPVDGVGDFEDQRFATCLYVEVDPATGTLEVARAGHLEPAVRSADGTVLVRSTAGGLPLGVDPDSDYPCTRLVLEPGETMLLCTDGLIETGGHDLVTGWERISSAFAKHGDRSLETLADSLVSTVHGPSSYHTEGPLKGHRDDDIALLLLRRSGRAAQHPVARHTALEISQGDPVRIAEARRQLRGLLHDWPDPEQVETAELLASELLANVVKHTDGDAWLVAEVTGRLGGRRLRVEVSDSSDELPHKQQPGELASSGRGLMLIEFLSDAWGVVPRGEGKTIWFELREPEAGTEGPAAGSEASGG